MTVFAFIITLVFIIIHISTSYLEFLDKIPRSRFLSIAGGVAVSYVFIQILPELSEHQSSIEEMLDSRFLTSLENHIYIIALLGLVVFYGLERMSKLSKENNLEDENSATDGAFWVHLTTTTIYNTIIGYLLLNRENDDFISLSLYGSALALHFFVVNHGLRQHHRKIYDKYGRWILSFGSFIGFLIGYTMEVNELFISILFSFLAGGIILNILKEELPEERKSSFGAFLIGSIGYSILLLLI